MTILTRLDYSRSLREDGVGAGAASMRSAGAIDYARGRMHQQMLRRSSNNATLQTHYSGYPRSEFADVVQSSVEMIAVLITAPWIA